MGRKPRDITGQRFGKLVAIKPIGLSSTRQHYIWLCQCDCGKQKEISIANLISGSTVSCGCYQSELSRKRLAEKTGSKNNNYKHGGAVGYEKSRIYRIWANMKNRCSNPKCPDYVNYGGRGIFVCEEWLNSFEAFKEWAISAGYSPDLTIERIDNNAGYCPQNCTWITKGEQSKNRRPYKIKKERNNK